MDGVQLKRVLGPAAHTHGEAPDAGRQIRAYPLAIAVNARVDLHDRLEDLLLDVWLLASDPIEDLGGGGP